MLLGMFELDSCTVGSTDLLLQWFFRVSNLHNGLFLNNKRSFSHSFPMVDIFLNILTTFRFRLYLGSPFLYLHWSTTTNKLVGNNMNIYFKKVAECQCDNKRKYLVVIMTSCFTKSIYYKEPKCVSGITDRLGGSLS